jgi:hypothetical protein
MHIRADKDMLDRAVLGFQSRLILVEFFAPREARKDVRDDRRSAWNFAMWWPTYSSRVYPRSSSSAWWRAESSRQRRPSAARPSRFRRNPQGPADCVPALLRNRDFSLHSILIPWVLSSVQPFLRPGSYRTNPAPLSPTVCRILRRPCQAVAESPPDRTLQACPECALARRACRATRFARR